MLSLSRKKNEDIIIGDDIVLRVGEIRSDRVVLLFDAPKDIRIDRREVRERCRFCGGDKIELVADKTGEIVAAVPCLKCQGAD